MENITDFTDLTVYPLAKFDTIEITNIIAVPSVWKISLLHKEKISST